jgi:hypothetical protein
MAGEKLIEVANQAVADYGFRQVALWSPDEAVERWGLSPSEEAVLTGALHDALIALPVPVEPADIPAEQARVAKLITAALP